MSRRISRTNVRVADVIVRVLGHLSRPRKLQLGLLFCLIIVSAVAELVSLGAVLPFLGVLVAPENVLAYPLIPRFADALGISVGEELVLPLTVAFCVAALAAGGLRLLLAWASVHFTYAAGADLSSEAYRRTLYQPYRVHLSRNSSEIISTTLQKISTVTHVLLALLNMISSAVLFFAILSTLLVIDAAMATIGALGMGAGYLLATRLSHLRVKRNSRRIAHGQSQVMQAMQEGLGGIRDVQLDGAQSAYSESFRRADGPLRKAIAENAFIAQRPRHIMEGLAIVLIAGIAYVASRPAGGVAAALPALGALALGAQRILPALQQIYQGWTMLSGSRGSLADALELLDQPLPEDALRPAPPPLPFREAIRFESVRFRYTNDGPWILNGFDLTISKGTRIGVVGATGSGKSTAMDLLMALIDPTQGRILVDGEPVCGDRTRAWQRAIAHVPQSVYITDTTIAENIAMGVPRALIDLDRVRQAATQAQIADFVEGQPEGYFAEVGERGVRLSGGQRQRIGIARALYKRAAVLVFDEATSSLDAATEGAVISAIDRLDPALTVVMVSHRVSALKSCATLVQVERGQVIAQGPYESLLPGIQSLRRWAT